MSSPLTRRQCGHDFSVDRDRLVCLVCRVIVLVYKYVSKAVSAHAHLQERSQARGLRTVNEYMISFVG